MLNHYLTWLRRPTPYDKALLVLLASIFLSIVVSPFISRSIRAALPLALGLVAYLVVAKWPSRLGQLILPWGALVGLGGLLSFLAPPAMLPPQHVVFRYLPGWLSLRRFLPDSFNANVIAGALVVLLPFALTGAAVDLRRAVNGAIAWRLVCLVVASSMLAVLFLTESRAAHVAALAAIGVLLALRWPRHTLNAAPLVLVALMVLTALFGPAAWTRWLQSGASRSMEQRLEIWSRAILVMQRYPLTGPGFGSFESLLASQYPLYALSRATVTHAHNLFLQVGVDLGLPGVISYVSILGSAFYTLFTICGILESSSNSFRRALALACSSSLVGLCLHGLMDAATWGNRGSFLPWVVLGIAASLYRLHTTDQKASP